MLYFAGDPHGDFNPINQAVDRERPEGVVLLGDFDLECPLEEALGPWAWEIPTWWIHGNHDMDREEWYDRLYESELADRCIHTRVVEVGGARIAGLGGVFREKVWHPETGVQFRTRREFMHSIGRKKLWRGGMPRKHRASIWFEDYERLFDQRADILVLHEAPSSHQYGFSVLDELAQAMRVSLVVHGHHHEDYTAVLPSGIKVIGVGLAGVTEETGRVVVPGQMSTGRRPDPAQRPVRKAALRK